MFIGGGVRGNVTVIGGDFTLSHAKVTGNVRIQGWSEFSITAGSEIDGSLTIENTSSAALRNPLCASRVAGNLLVSDNDIPIEIGSPQASCPGNISGRNVVIKNNADSIEVYDNQITKDLRCFDNISLAGGGNSARDKEGQCVPF
jgi:cytoskeletal protein CcmA (bactofilin family)